MATVSMPTTLLTAEEFAARHENDRVELVKGIVTEVPMPGFRHGVIANLIAFELTMYVRERELGWVTTNDSFVRVSSNPDTVRGPDVAFFSYERLPPGEPPTGVPPVSPDFVVEVRSPHDRLSALNAKALEYLAAGVRAVLVLDPELAAATVFRENELPQTFHNGDSITVSDVLPGLSVPLAKLFR